MSLRRPCVTDATMIFRSRAETELDYHLTNVNKLKNPSQLKTSTSKCRDASGRAVKQEIPPIQTDLSCWAATPVNRPYSASRAKHITNLVVLTVSQRISCLFHFEKATVLSRYLHIRNPIINFQQTRLCKMTR